MTRSLATLLPLFSLLFLRFSSGGLYERAKYISRTCNYANTSNYRAVGRSERAVQGKRGSRCCVRVASYSTVDEIRRSTGYHRINPQLESRKKRRGDRLYNPWLTASSIRPQPVPRRLLHGILNCGFNYHLYLEILQDWITKIKQTILVSRLFLMQVLKRGHNRYVI